MTMSISDTEHNKALSECRNAGCNVLCTIMLNVIMLNIIVLSAVMLSVIMLNVIMLSVMAPVRPPPKVLVLLQSHNSTNLVPTALNMLGCCVSLCYLT
jgi:hypothetical protein